MYVNWSENRSVLSDSLQPHGLYSPWNSLGQNTGVGSTNPGIEPRSGRFFTSWASREEDLCICITKFGHGTGHGKTDWFQFRKGVHQGCILSPCLFNLYAEYVMQNDSLDEAQPGIKTAARNVSNLRYADDTIHMAESEEELKSLLMKVRKQWKQWQTLFSWAPKLLWMVTAAMK